MSSSNAPMTLAEAMGKIRDEYGDAIEALGDNCRSGCPTPGLHRSWGECAKSANLQTLVGDTVDANRRLERNLDEYRAVRKQGIQPKSIRRTYVEAAKEAAGA